jgi:hypothetical protein
VSSLGARARRAGGRLLLVPDITFAPPAIADLGADTDEQEYGEVISRPGPRANNKSRLTELRTAATHATTMEGEGRSWGWSFTSVSSASLSPILYPAHCYQWPP